MRQKSSNLRSRLWMSSSQRYTQATRIQHSVGWHRRCTPLRRQCMGTCPLKCGSTSVAHKCSLMRMLRPLFPVTQTSMLSRHDVHVRRTVRIVPNFRPFDALQILHLVLGPG